MLFDWSESVMNSSVLVSNFVYFVGMRETPKFTAAHRMTAASAMASARSPRRTEAEFPFFIRPTSSSQATAP